MIGAWITAVRRRLGLLFRRVVAWPQPGFVDFGSFGRTTPVSSRFGLDRGRPLDRFYIEEFVSAHAALVRGRVLEFGDDAYTRRFGGSAVAKSDVIHPAAGHPGATIAGDLVSGLGIPDGAFDCIVCTQVLQFVFDLPSAVRSLHRALAPGGVLLGTVPVVSMASPTDAAEFGEFWRITSQGMRRLLEADFEPASIDVRAFGNVLSAVGFLHGLAAEEIPKDCLQRSDPTHEVLVAFVARKATAQPL